MEKKVNIGFFGTRGLGNYGGFETIAQKLHENLDGENFNFYVSKEIEQKEEYKIEVISEKTKIISQKKGVFNKVSKYLDNILNEGKILRESYKNNPWNLDVVFQCGSTPGLSMSKVTKDKPILLWNPDGIEWKREKFPLYGRAILYLSTLRGIKNSHAITVDSKAIGKYLKNMNGDKPVYYLPSGTDIVEEKDVSEEVLEKYGLEKNRYYIMVGRAVPENHIIEILNYFLKTKTEKQLMIVANFGDDDYSKQALKIIEENKNRLVYKGPIYDQKELKSVRYFSYAYVHGHSVGGTNPSLLEALGAGNPCICFDVEYNREVSRDAGMYFLSEETFKSSIDEMESLSFESWNELKQKAKKIIEEDFTWEYISEVHEAVVMDILLKLNKIKQEEFKNWLAQKKYMDRLENNNYNFLKLER